MAVKIYYTMGEMAELLDVRQSVIRHWEKEFGLHPTRNKKGNRLFSEKEVETLKRIHYLVRERGMKLEGAKKALRLMQRESRTASRDTELLERLQRIRAQLLEVREALKACDGELVDDAFAEEVGGSEAAACGAPSRMKLRQDAAAQAAEPLSADRDSVPEGVFEEIPVLRIGESDEAPRAAEGIVRKGRKAVVKIAEQTAAVEDDDVSKQTRGASRRRPRRKKGEAENKELFAFYEQSLF